MMDRNEKKIHASNIVAANAIRISSAAKEKPDEKVKEYFKRKPYHLIRKGQENEEECKTTNAEGKTEGHEQY